MLHLNESYIATNRTLHRSARHVYFAKPLFLERCERVTFFDDADRCPYARFSPACRKEVFLLNYYRFYYCHCSFDSLLRIGCVVVLLLECMLLFWIIYYTTTRFMVPAVTGLARIFKLNEYVAGVTIISVSSNAPGIFGTVVSINDETRHPFSDTMSVNLFMGIVATSLIMWVQPFTIDGVYFVRDIGFVILSVSYVDFAVSFTNGNITVPWALSMALICPIYIVIIIVDQYLMHRREKAIITHEAKLSLNVEGGQALNTENNPKLARRVPKRSRVPPNYKIFRQFFHVFDTLDRSAFRSKWTIFKIWALLKVLPLMAIRLLIPIMALPHSKMVYSKLLCCIQIVITPLLIIFLFVNNVLNKPYWILIALSATLVILLPVAVVGFAHSRTDSVPQWYKYMNIVCILSCLFILFGVTKELNALLEAIGIIMNRSHTFIGCTLYTWGSCLSDLMSVLSMARNGLPRMAFSACYGVIILATFTSVCMPFVYITFARKNRMANVTEGTQGYTASTMLTIALVMTLLYAVTTNFMMRRSGALLGIIIYLLFLVFCVSSEFEFTHAYGTDHTLDRVHFDDTYTA